MKNNMTSNGDNTSPNKIGDEMTTPDENDDLDI